LHGSPGDFIHFQPRSAQTLLDSSARGIHSFWPMAKGKATRRISRKDFEDRVPQLRENLVQLQVALKDAAYPVLLVLEGVEGAGRGEVMNTLGGWMDPRGLETLSFREPTDEERERPLMWRYWRSLPAHGRLGIYASSWYTRPLQFPAHDRDHRMAFGHELQRIREFENMLADDGTLIVKIWLQLSKAEQGARLRRLESDEYTAWRVTADHWRQHRVYDRQARLSESVRRATQGRHSPWTIVPAADERTRDVAVAQTLLARFQAHHRTQMARRRRPSKLPAHPQCLRPAGLRRLRALPLDQELAAAAYESKREKWLGRLNGAVRAAHEQKRSIVFVFEGWDAAGKGGAIRRLTNAIDARDYRVIPIAKPTDEEKAHHYLWRFWRHVPRAGMVTIYDRSWYGRVLVERLEGFARRDEWRRAFDEINDFEQQLVEHGIIVVKYWLHISKDEQLRRFREREKTAYKRHKINDEDWRNRRKWDAYEIAVGDMLGLTDTAFAGWQLVPANNKRYARLQVLKTACKKIEEALQHPGARD
jgi:polyphosphate:AMP phosphotransferase